LSLWTARHRRPSAVRVKVTFPITPFSLGSPSPLLTELSAAWPADWAVVFALRRVATEAGVPPVLVGPAPGEPALRTAGAAGPAVEPPVVGDAAVSGAAVGAGVVPSPLAGDVVLTEVEPAVVVAEVVGVVCLATACPLAAGAWVVGGTRDWITAMLGFEPPLPPGATVVETGVTVLVVVAATGAVVGGVVVGTVVAGATVVLAALPAVPWVLVGAPEAAWAEAGRAPRSRKRPARSAKDAAHLRGRTTSLLGLELIRPDRRPSVWLRAREA
jgi:hypothetical protein